MSCDWLVANLGNLITLTNLPKMVKYFCQKKNDMYQNTKYPSVWNTTSTFYSSILQKYTRALYFTKCVPNGKYSFANK